VSTSGSTASPHSRGRAHGPGSISRTVMVKARRGHRRKLRCRPASSVAGAAAQSSICPRFIGVPLRTCGQCAVEATQQRRLERAGGIAWRPSGWRANRRLYLIRSALRRVSCASRVAKICALCGFFVSGLRGRCLEFGIGPQKHDCLDKQRCGYVYRGRGRMAASVASKKKLPRPTPERGTGPLHRPVSRATEQRREGRWCVD